MSFQSNVFGRAAVAAVVVFASVSVSAVTPLSELRYSPDITTIIGTPAVTVGPANVVSDHLAGPIGLINIGSLPPGARLVAYHRLNNGDSLLVTDTTVILSGITFGPRDVVRYNGSAYSSFFAGATHGIPDGVRIVGLALVNNIDPLLAFDTTVVLSGVTVKPTDIVRWNGSSYSLFFDSAAAGVADGLSIQDFHYLDSNAHLLLSFGTSGIVGAVNFDRADVLEYTPGTPGTWELAYSGIAHSDGWDAADMTALFAVAGTPALPQSVPTLSNAALVLLALCMVAIAFAGTRQSRGRRPVA
jgi:IPTL-CTERM motif